MLTDRSLRVLQLANNSAWACNHEYVGTEHILIGLIQEPSGVASHVLRNFGLNSDKISDEAKRIVQPASDIGSFVKTSDKIPLSPRAKEVVEQYAPAEAKSLNHNYIGTEHLLLGVLVNKESIATQILANLGVDAEEVYIEVLNTLGIEEVLNNTLGIEIPPEKNYKKVNCLICDKELQYEPGPNHNGCVIDGGFMLVSFHYGSKHDQCHGWDGRKNEAGKSPIDTILACDEIEAFICDDCFEKKFDKMHGYDVHRKSERKKKFGVD